MHKKIEEIKPNERNSLGPKVNYNSIKSIENYETKNQPYMTTMGNRVVKTFHDIASLDMI